MIKVTIFADRHDMRLQSVPPCRGELPFIPDVGEMLSLGVGGDVRVQNRFARLNASIVNITVDTTGWSDNELEAAGFGGFRRGG